MPILRQHDVVKGVDQPVDQGHDLIALGHRELAAWAKIVLYVDDDQDGS
jgi:hypothetical protein